MNYVSERLQQQCAQLLHHHHQQQHHFSYNYTTIRTLSCQLVSGLCVGLDDINACRQTPMLSHAKFALCWGRLPTWPHTLPRSSLSVLPSGVFRHRFRPLRSVAIFGYAKLMLMWYIICVCMYVCVCVCVYVWVCVHTSEYLCVLPFILCFAMKANAVFRHLMKCATLRMSNIWHLQFCFHLLAIHEGIYIFIYKSGKNICTSNN